MRYAPHPNNETIPGCKNFTWGEVTKNGTRPIQASSQGGRKLTARQVEDNVINIATWLQRLRNELQLRAKRRSFSIHVTSWFRPPAVNRDIGGASASHHLGGGAVDFYLVDWTPEEVVDALFDIGFPGGVGVSISATGWFIHIDLGARRAWNYNGSARSVKVLEYIKKRMGQWR
ncbi:MAG: DUF882 domain-containing protein [Gammaproteobacteria bacterium]|nr:MAG: DUF882 domain-containing protein [Gammaproteobacteria bacterium]